MKRKFTSAVCAMLIPILSLLCACSPSQPEHISFEAMDTLMTLTVYGDSEIGNKLQDRIAELDALWDATDEGSEIYRLNHEKHLSVSADTAALIRRSLELSAQLDGSFDPTILPAVQAWGFDSGDYRVPGKAELAALSERVDYSSVSIEGDGQVRLSEKTSLDPGAVAKGRAADLCGDMLTKSKARAAVLNLGGTIRLYGEKPDGSPFRVGVADPENPASYYGYLNLKSGTVATSGGYERYFEKDGKRYIHILDPKTAAPVENGILSVTIICDDGTAADALSTALFVMGREKAAEVYRERRDFDFVILTDSGEIYLSEGIYDSFTLGNGYEYHIEAVH